MSKPINKLEAIPTGLYSDQDLIKINQQADRYLERIEFLNLSHQRLQEMMAMQWAKAEFFLEKLKSEQELSAAEAGSIALQLTTSLVPFVFDYMEKTITKKNKERGKQAADARHSQPGGSRDKQHQMRQIWASGKYSSKDICAEQECAALGVAFSTARKALRNAPLPQKST